MTEQMTEEKTSNVQASGTDSSSIAQDETSSAGASTADLAYGGSDSGGETGDTQRDTVPSGTGSNAPLFASDQAQDFKSRWGDVQAAFVDDPQGAVKQADALVAETMKRLAQIFADEREKLETQWSSGGDVSTEDLRLALQRYRSFFDRLLSF